MSHHLRDRLPRLVRRQEQVAQDRQIAQAIREDVGPMALVTCACGTQFRVSRAGVPAAQCPGCGRKLVYQTQSGPRQVTSR